jgi:hypothetical protein
MNTFKGKESGEKPPESDNTSIQLKTCGIIMPISPHPDYPIDHWKDVLKIIIEAIPTDEFRYSLVSDDEAIGLIHERIVTNIYNNEMIVCDVSGKNPNVMFELGLRVAFDKPVIIIKDDKTTYSFDTGVIEHLTYPSSLRFGDIVAFKNDLSNKIKATYKRSLDSNFSPFLKGFGKTIIPASIKTEEVTETKYLIDQIMGLKDAVYRLSTEVRGKRSLASLNSETFLRNQVVKYLDDIIKKSGTVSESELLQYTVEEFKGKYPTISDLEVKTIVSDVINHPAHIH